MFVYRCSTNDVYDALLYVITNSNTVRLLLCNSDLTNVNKNQIINGTYSNIVIFTVSMHITHDNMIV